MSCSLSVYDYSGYKRLTRSVVAWFIDYYKLDRYKFDVDVVCKGLWREGLKGSCTVLGSAYRPRCFEIEIHNGLERGSFVATLMHEMLHVKQWLTSDRKERQGENYWHGKHIDASTEYMDEPWEIEAYALEHGLAKLYLATV